MDKKCCLWAVRPAAYARENWWEVEDNASLWLGLGGFFIWEVKREIGEDWRDDGDVGVG